MNEMPTVFIIEPEEESRQRLQDLLQVAGFNVESFPSAGQFLDECQPERVGCVLAARQPTDMDVMELRDRLLAKGCDQPFIVIDGDSDVVKRAVEAMKRGAANYIQRPFPPARLIESVRESLQADSAARPQKRKRQALRNRIDSLSARQRQVFNLLLQGKSTKEIARLLDISISTVENHRRRVLGKMGVRDVANLIRLVVDTAR